MKWVREMGKGEFWEKKKKSNAKIFHFFEVEVSSLGKILFVNQVIKWDNFDKVLS